MRPSPRAGAGDAASLLMRREHAKHRRYRGPGLVPFALTARGRWGKEALGWGRSAARHFFGEGARDKFTELKYVISAALQVEVAEQVLACMTAPPPSCS